ncbi:hypothetical protein JTE90_004533 [Oedothorax gibbosus]|uniref:Uncharacterized protein n=1 Tax=Oedothorax gibbosus TaxID=931172 RepID=A0AAV6VCB2_9ARAC|nr:hypothetical protein JTE90_004533 [Oedothorax gibbosus]
MAKIINIEETPLAKGKSGQKGIRSAVSTFSPFMPKKHAQKGLLTQSVGHNGPLLAYWTVWGIKGVDWYYVGKVQGLESFIMRALCAEM